MIAHIFSVLIFILTANCWQPNRNIAIPENTRDFDYSADQKFLAVMTNKNLNIYYAQTLKDLKSGIIAQAGQQFRSFAFSPDSMYLAIGLQEGNANLYKFNDGSFEKIQTWKSQKTQSLINDVCFLGPTKIIFALNQFIVAFWDFETGDKFEYAEEPTFIRKVCCSPINEKEFMSVSGSNTDERLNFYNLNEGKIENIKKIEITADSKIFGTTYSKDGTKLYAVGKQKTIFSYDTTTFQKTIILNEGINGELRKVRVSNDNNIFAVATTQNIFIFTLNQQKVNNLYSFPTVLDSVALSEKGGHVFYASQKLKGIDLGACPESEFYEDEIGKCQKCTDSCDLCWYNATECFLCKQRFFIQNNQCQKCGSGCLICSDTTNCSSCDSSGKFIPDGTKCKCNSSYFLDGDSNCSPCIKNCHDCTNGTQCKNCFEPYTVKGGICVCHNGTYDDGSTCKPCIKHCQICTNGTLCETCQDPFTGDGKGMCICKNGTYPNGQTCSKCMVNCVICQNEKVCKTCKDKFEVDEKGDCSCKKGTFFNGETCVPCMKNCEECSDNFECQNCTLPFIIDENKGICVCSEREFDDGKTCQPCIERCLKCTNQKQCQICDQHFIKDNKGICSCDQAQFDDGQVCQPCLLHCKTCSNENYCEECYQPFQDIDKDKKACKCNERTYDNGKTCAPCNDHCQNCKIGQKCQICDPFFNISQQGVCFCQKGTFLDRDTCTTCQNGCLQCEDGVSCLSCDNDRHFILSNNTCQCDSLNNFILKNTECICRTGTYLNNVSICKECSDECATCNSGEDCTTCKGNQTLKDGQCSCTSLTQFYDPVKHSCVICSSVIEFCERCDDGDSCIKCNVTTTRIIRNGLCVCSTGSYEDQKKICQSCDVIDGCLDCISINVCKKCNFESGWELNQTTKQCQCQQLHYRNKHFCILCEIENCISCLETNNCSRCSANRRLQQNKCLCFDGYYQNKTDYSKCQKCQEGCNKCNDGDSCIQCNQKGNWVLISGKCSCVSGFYQVAKTCHNCTQKYEDCIACTADLCKNCKGDLKSIDNKCKCASPKQYQDKTSCFNCSQNCLTCDLNKDRCLSCAEGQYLGQDFICHPQDSNNILIIIIIVAGGIVVLGIICFVISRVMKGRRVQPSVSQDYSQLQQNKEETVA